MGKSLRQKDLEKLHKKESTNDIYLAKAISSPNKTMYLFPQPAQDIKALL